MGQRTLDCLHPSHVVPSKRRPCVLCDSVSCMTGGGRLASAPHCVRWDCEMGRAGRRMAAVDADTSCVCGTAMGTPCICIMDPCWLAAIMRIIIMAPASVPTPGAPVSPPCCPCGLSRPWPGIMLASPALDPLPWLQFKPSALL